MSIEAAIFLSPILSGISLRLIDAFLKGKENKRSRKYSKRIDKKTKKIVDKKLKEIIERDSDIDWYSLERESLFLEEKIDILKNRPIDTLYIEIFNGIKNLLEKTEEFTSKEMIKEFGYPTFNFRYIPKDIFDTRSHIPQRYNSIKSNKVDEEVNFSNASEEKIGYYTSSRFFFAAAEKNRIIKKIQDDYNLLKINK